MAKQYLMDVGFEFEIGAPWAMRTVARKIGAELGIRGLKVEVDLTVETNAKYNGEISTPVWPLAKGISNLRRIFKWFEKNGIVTNETCGFHVNLSFKRTELNWMIDKERLILSFNEEKWLRLCKRSNNYYAGCYIDELICDAPKSGFKDEEARNKWVAERIDDFATDRFYSINTTHLDEGSPYVEYRCLGGTGYHLRWGVMTKAIVDMVSNMKRALPAARGASLRGLKLKECFKVRGITDKRSIIPH
jgi:hypothetical protein|tara:strand:+ start:1384 stop:2124 length:741 start_codon:yes stop_codon:yes gene_type:complete